MGDQHIAAFEQGARITQLDTLALTISARDCRSGWRGNQGNKVGERIHGGAISHPTDKDIQESRARHSAGRHAASDSFLPLAAKPLEGGRSHSEVSAEPT